MSGVEDRLRALGLTLPDVPAPVASYIPALRSGDHVFTSGQLPVVDGRLPVTGKVGLHVDPGQARELARLAALNALAAVRSVTGDLDAVRRVVRLVGYVNSAPDFTGQAQVLNGASDLLVEVFADAAGRHVRSSVGVAVLPFDAPVEVELVVEVR